MFPNPDPNPANCHFRGDPEALCSGYGPGFCYVECNRACSDEKPTASRGRFNSSKLMYMNLIYG